MSEELGMAIAFLVSVFLMAGAAVISGGDTAPPDSTAAAVAPPVDTVPIAKDTEASVAIALVEERLVEMYRGSLQVVRPRNHLVTFVASNPQLLDVYTSFWLESVDTGLVQKCEGHFTIERGEAPAIRGELWGLECE